MSLAHDVKSNGEILRHRWVWFLYFLGMLSSSIPLLVYGYLGNFSRYLSDDYCASAYLNSQKNIFQITWDAYNTWFNSYSRLFFIQMFDGGATWGIRLIPGVTFLIWGVLLALLFSRLGKSIGIRIHPLVGLWCAFLAIYLSFYQTSVLYQILFWRTGWIPYTLPIVLFTGIAVFTLWYFEKPYAASRARWAVPAVLIMVLIAGGLSETTSALQVGMWFCAFGMAWLMSKSIDRRRDCLFILGTALACAVLALLITAASPGTSNRLDRIMENSPAYNPLVLSMNVIAYTAQFLFDAVKSFPLLVLIAFAVPFGCMLLLPETDQKELDGIRSSLKKALLVVPVVVFLVIGFSYAPSAFVLHYPVARARFPSHVLLMFGLILEGGILGILVSGIKMGARSSTLRLAAALLLGLLILHPLRAAPKILTNRYEYQTFSIAWDERDRFIRQAIADGKTDLVVTQLDAPGGVGEYKGNPRHFINKCAADFYGLDSIIAP